MRKIRKEWQKYNIFGMIKRTLLLGLALVILFSSSGCGKKELVPEEYGFKNNFGMTTWIEVNEYNLDQGVDSLAVYTQQKHNCQLYIEFTSKKANWSMRDLIAGTDEGSDCEVKVLNNDTVILYFDDEGEEKLGITIIERHYNAYGHLVIEAEADGDSMYFVLWDQVAQVRNSFVEDSAEYIYFFRE